MSTRAADAASWAPLPPHVRAGGVALDDDAAAEQVLTGALQWLEAQVEWFAPGRWEEFLPRRPFRPGPLLELLGLLRILERAGVLSMNAPLTRHALDIAQETADEPDFGHGLRRADEFFPYHLNFIGLLELLGRPRAELRADCQALLTADAGGHTRAYKPVLNRIELRYFVDRGHFTAPSRLPDIGTLHRQSIAALDPDVLRLTESETYAFTHVLFYTTDFGHHRDVLRDGGSETRLHEAVRALLGLHLARGSLDLLAELLLCERVLDGGGGPGPLTNQAWNALARAQRPDGALPSPVHRPEVLAGLGGDKATAYLFGTCYHTTQAAALAAVAHLRASAAEVRTPRRTAPAEHLLPCADPEEIRHWARQVTTAAPTATAEARAAWSAHLDPLLALTVRQRDRAVLADLLHAAEHLGQSNRPLVRSAATLLGLWTQRPAPDRDLPRGGGPPAQG
ncbi:hypothetical protein [Streptomyces sp. SID5643]|uniref:DUF6895 family protein n=1 Tax=Streptomyces sp. SID5643 TaxID=2690307 RepID=UPI001371E8A9|nr:hypothetical protein [Streptomyces sp. SID5643]MZF87649.1 hypothetical protein [Streptomyces sp. SID5643]